MDKQANRSKPQEKYRFLLFVAGMSPKSSRAVENMRRICDIQLAGNFELQIIDLSHEHKLAAEYQIVAIPTLIKLVPGPKRIVIGDLSETQKVLKILDL